MKSIFSSIICLFLLVAYPLTSKSFNWLGIAPGSELVYDVDFYGDKYQFIVNIKDIGVAVSFDYSMTNSQKTSGSIVIPASALDKSYKQMNYFAGGAALLTDQTTVFFSKQPFMDIISGQTVDIQLSEEESISLRMSSQGLMRGEESPDQVYEEGTVIPGTSYLVNGEEASVGHMLFYNDEDGSHAYTVTMDKNHPLITYMNLGWTIQLVKITNPIVIETEQKKEIIPGQK